MGFSQSLLGVRAGGDIVWQKPNITNVAIHWEKHKYRNFTDIIEYQNFSRVSQSL